MRRAAVSKSLLVARHFEATVQYKLRTLLVLLAIGPPTISAAVRLHGLLRPTLVHTGVHVNNVTWEEGVREAERTLDNSSCDLSRLNKHR